MKKGLTITALLLALVLSLCACNSGEDSGAKATNAPTSAPTDVPTEAPTEEPTQAPTEEPTATPTLGPTRDPNSTSEPFEHTDENMTQLDESQLYAEDSSSSYENPGEGWCMEFVVDGDHDDVYGHGWSTAPHQEDDDCDAYIVISLEGEQEVCRVVLWPRRDPGIEVGLYFPICYDIDVSTDGATWTTVKSVSGDYGSEEGDESARVIDFDPVFCSYIRIHGTELSDVNPSHADGYMMQFSEIEVFVTKR